jgi:glycerate 2-kinase
VTDADISFDRERRRAHAGTILRSAIAAAEPAALVARALAGATELDARRIRVLAVGKAARAMMAAALQALERRVGAALVIEPHDTAAAHDGAAPYRIIQGSHPLPADDSVAAGRAVLDFVAGCGADESLLVLLSGGGSSIMCAPLGDVDVRDYARCVDLLMRAGAGIAELNTVRRHIDGVKGGRLAVHARSTPVLCLALSDVVGDDVAVIASGPFSPDPTTCADALDVLRRYDVIGSCSPAIVAVLESGAGETPAADAAAFADVRVRVIGGNDVAILGAARTAAELCYDVRRAPLPVTGEAAEAGGSLAREALLLQRQEAAPLCIVAGGETTVTVRGSGRGGRNQELVLAACNALDGTPGITVGSIATDGVDGATDAAGAVADEQTLNAAVLAGLDAAASLADNDSYSFFDSVSGLLKTGATGTNVNDVQIALVIPQPPAVTPDDPQTTPDPRHP